jgi:hypothetical protein
LWKKFAEEQQGILLDGDFFDIFSEIEDNAAKFISHAKERIKQLYNKLNTDRSIKVIIEGYNKIPHLGKTRETIYNWYDYWKFYGMENKYIIIWSNFIDALNNELFKLKDAFDERIEYRSSSLINENIDEIVNDNKTIVVSGISTEDFNEETNRDVLNGIEDNRKKYYFNIIIYGQTAPLIEMNGGRFTITQPYFKDFYYKWEKLLSHKNKASAIYAMFSDYVCNNSSTKLTGQMSFMISILVSALNIEEQTIDNAIKTCIKKYFIEKYLNQTRNTDLDRIKASIKVLLDDDLQKNTNHFIISNDNKYINDINDKLNNISNSPDDENKQNIFFELVSLITEAIKDMKNKPLIQDSVSLITYINNSCINNNLSCNSTYVKINDLSDNIISNISNYYTRPPINLENYILDLIKNKNNLHLIPYLYVIMDQEKNANNVKPSIKKLKESKHLGLYYKGLIPYININTNPNIFFDDISNNKIIINSDTKYNITGNTIDDTLNILPLIGNYLVNPLNATIRRHDFQNSKTFEYYKYDINRYRPPIKDIVKNATNYVQYKIKKILSTLLYSAISEKNLYTIIESNSKLSEAFTDIYIYLSFIYDFLVDGEIKIYINNIIKNINDYNAYLLLYHYLFLSDKIYKIPKFNYYLLPLLDKKNGGKFIYFNSKNTIDLNTKYDANGETKTIIIDISNNIQANIRNANSYLRVMENIENNIISGKYIIKTDHFIQSKSNKLPPAIIEKLKDFYTYNIKLLLIELYDNRDRDRNIFEKIKKLNKYININNPVDIFIDNDIMTYLFMSKIVEELIKEKMKYYIESQTNRILYKVIKKKNLEKRVTFEDTNLILAPQELILNMNIDEITNGIKHFFYKYQFSKVKKPEPELDKFIIYPDEYANSEILKLKYELIIKKDIYEILLENNSNPYILDSNNQSPIFSLLKNHIPDILKDIKYLNYTEFTEVNPYNFLLLELNNHTHKLTNDKDEYKDWIENFVSYQKNEVTTLILSNDKFGNNEPLYLEDSFNVITYITNQYLSESIYEDEDEDINILKCEKDKINYKTYLFINTQIDNLEVYKKLENNIAQNIIDNNNIEIEKINNTLKKTNKQYKTILESKKKQLDNKNKQYENQIKDSTKYGGTSLDDENILKRYKQLQNNILTILLSKFINIDLTNSCDLLTFKIITLEQQILNKSLEEIKSTNSSDVTQISNFYKITNKISNIYFTFNKYTEYNQVLKFSKELLEFMTERFICFPYFMLLNKILTHYFKTIYVIDNDNDILTKVNYCLTNKILKEDNQSIETILYNHVSKKLVLNAVQIFDNQEEETLFSPQSTKDIFDTVVNLLTINPSLSIPEDSPFFKTTIKEINSYFDTFVNKTILNWLVVIENVFKFNINQGRIIQSIYNLHF